MSMTFNCCEREIYSPKEFLFDDYCSLSCLHPTKDAINSGKQPEDTGYRKGMYASLALPMDSFPGARSDNVPPVGGQAPFNVKDTQEISRHTHYPVLYSVSHHLAKGEILISTKCV